MEFDLAHLEGISLFMRITTFYVKNGDSLEFGYLGKEFSVTPRGDLPASNIRLYLLSDIGRELIRLLNPTFDEKYWQAMYDDFFNQSGLTITILEESV